MSSSDFVRHYTEDKTSSHKTNHEELVHNDGPVVVTADEVIGTGHRDIHVEFRVDKFVPALTFHCVILEITTRAITLKNGPIELTIIRLRIIGAGEYVPDFQSVGLKGKRAVNAVTLIPAPELRGRHYGKGGDEDVDTGTDGRQPEEEGEPLLPGPELPELSENTVIIHREEKHETGQ